MSSVKVITPGLAMRKDISKETLEAAIADLGTREAVAERDQAEFDSFNESRSQDGLEVVEDWQWQEMI